MSDTAILLILGGLAILAMSALVWAEFRSRKSKEEDDKRIMDWLDRLKKGKK